MWRAGRTAEALRTAASYCLSHTLPHATEMPVIDDNQFTQLLAVLVTLTEDAAYRTRLYGIRSLVELGRLLDNDAHQQRLQKWTNDSVVALLKRLDDPTELVRVEALNSLSIVVQRTNELNTHNVQYLVDTVLIHVDDEDNVIKQAALGKLTDIIG